MGGRKRKGVRERELEELIESALKAEGRLVGARLEQATWKIFGYARENRGSLSSEVHCRMILGMVEAAVAKEVSRGRVLLGELHEERAKLKGLRREMKLLESRVRGLESENGRLREGMVRSKQEALKESVEGEGDGEFDRG